MRRDRHHVLTAVRRHATVRQGLAGRRAHARRMPGCGCSPCGWARPISRGASEHACASHKRPGGLGHGVWSRAWSVGDMCSRAGTVTVWLHVRVSPAAGWARSWCVVVCEVGGWLVRPSGYGHDVWHGAPCHHAWLGWCGTSGRVGTVMVCGRVCGCHQRPGGLGHGVWPGAPCHHAWFGWCGTSGRVGTVMVCGRVCGCCQRPGGLGHGVWLGAHGHRAWLDRRGASGRAGTVMACGRVCSRWVACVGE